MFRSWEEQERGSEDFPVPCAGACWPTYLFGSSKVALAGLLAEFSLLAEIERQTGRSVYLLKESCGGTQLWPMNALRMKLT
jgi:hypothetical protein